MKKTIVYTMINMLMVIVLGLITYYCTDLQEKMTLSVFLGESHVGKNNIAQLFYSDTAEDFEKNSPVTQTFSDNVIPLAIGEIDFRKNIVRIDPFNQKENFSIEKLEVSYGKQILFVITAKELEQYIQEIKGMTCELKENKLHCQSKKRNPRMIMNKSFSDVLYRYYSLYNILPYVAFFVLYCLIGIWELRGLRSDKSQGRFRFLVRGGAMLLLCIGVLVFYVLKYFETYFGQVPIGQLVYHLHTPLDGTDISSYQDAIVIGIILVIVCVFFWGGCCFVTGKWKVQEGYTLWSGFLGLMLVVYSGIQVCLHYDIIEYYQYTHTGTTLYEDYYVDGRDVTITFPKQKRNMIYILLESMEITYADGTSGGAMTTNYIPELTNLALENNCFSDRNSLNGAYQVEGATFTMGALAAQTSGVPINTSLVSNDTLNGTWESENNYLPGVWSIGDILAEQGYNQEFLIGSVGDFAGRSSYFKGHGGYRIEDYNVAIEKERIPADYKVWWGYEDKKLFDFAKEDLKKLASEGEPFNLTMLTVDTHFTDGYKCDFCKDAYQLQYSNVITCSDKLVAEFVGWVKKQDFYDNTTIVISGDHLTNDSAYISNTGVAGFDRRMYFTIVNPAEGKEAEYQKRSYTSLDLYPTALSSLGVLIEGDRLGLGVDLYSDKKTLVEEIGLEQLNVELMKNSEYYTKELLYK